MFKLVLKRLLLLPITLVGVSLLVFALVAKSPAGLSGEEELSSESEAVLNERYGLGDPMLVQYGRWLRRVCPLKFGELDQRDAEGLVIRAPVSVSVPPLWRWYAEVLPEVDGTWVGPDRAAPIADRLEAYAATSRAHERTWSAYMQARDAALRGAKRYALAVGRPLPKDAADDASLGPPRKDLPEFVELVAAGKKCIELYRAAIQTRVMLAGALEARPLESDGVPIIPGVLGLAWPDLGQSMVVNRPVIAIIGEALPQTVMLNLCAIVLVYLIGIPGGVLAAVRRGTWIDSTIGVLFTGLWSIPSVWVALMALGFLCGAPPRGLGWFPIMGLHAREAENAAFLPGWGSAGFEPGYALDTLWHMVLPVLCLSYGSLAVLSKQVRSATLEHLRSDFVRTARAKGASGWQVLTRHVLRNSLLPMITLFVGVFPALLSGSVVVERAFGIPGTGSLLVQSFYSHDREVLLGSTIMMAAVNVLALLLADVLYVLADPRVRIGAETGAGGGSGA